MVRTTVHAATAVTAELLEAVGDKYQLTVYDGEYHTPRWFGEGITYNIFPDRFCRDKAPEQPEGEGVVAACAASELGRYSGIPAG